MNNLPNKIKIINLNCFDFQSIVFKKIPSGTVYILNIENLSSKKMNLNKFIKLTQLIILNVYNKEYVDRQLRRLSYYNDDKNIKIRMSSFYLVINNYEYQLINNYYKFNEISTYPTNNLYLENTNINLLNYVINTNNNDDDSNNNRTKFIWNTISNSFITSCNRTIVSKKLYNSQTLCSFCDLDKINDNIEFYVKMLQSKQHYLFNS